jgi:hypothetical protein
MDKICTKCGVIKSVSEFYKSKRGLFGVRADCKACVYLRQRSVTKTTPSLGELKTCTKCHTEKLIGDFGKSSITKSGLRYICKNCKMESDMTRRRNKGKIKYSYMKNRPSFRSRERRRFERRRDSIANLIIELKSSPCKDCGKNFPYYCMDFDHLDGSVKKLNIKEIKSSPSKKHILEEISKCELVCVNCYRLRMVRRIQESGKFYSSSNVVTVKVRNFLLEIKSDPCKDCGSSFHQACMDFDHVRGEKLGTISELSRRFGKDKLTEEITKCDLVCACCHRVRTYSRMKFEEAA